MGGKDGIDVSIGTLIDYTDWERGKWWEWLRGHGDDALKTSVGEHGDGRFKTVGDYIKHIFSAEKRYIDRLSGRPITETAAMPSDNIDALFEFGEQRRRELRKFLKDFPAEEWDSPQEFKLMNSSFTVTPRKILIHVMLHEIRHWAQIATLFRLNGLSGEFHDFLFSPVLGVEIKKAVSK